MFLFIFYFIQGTVQYEKTNVQLYIHVKLNYLIKQKSVNMNYVCAIWYKLRFSSSLTALCS